MTARDGGLFLYVVGVGECRDLAYGCQRIVTAGGGCDTLNLYADNY